MTGKSDFTPDEWKLLLESVTMAGIAVTAAEPSGLWGLLKESFAGGTALVTAKMDPQSNPLIKAVVADFDTAQGRSTAREGLKEKLAGCKPAEIKAKCIETLRQAAAVVDTKAPADAGAFKGWLRQISQHVAEAAKEGGFLGIGGVRVSEAEKATLTEISSALKLAA
jgi:ribosomal protein L10